VDEATKRMLSLEKVGLGHKTQPANYSSNAVHHWVILALAIKMCVPTLSQRKVLVSRQADP
jgi:hypothetical protein